MNTVIIVIIDLCMAFVIGDQISDWVCITAASTIHPVIDTVLFAFILRLLGHAVNNVV